MSPIARKFFIAALVYLILGLLAQAVTLFDAWLGFNPLAYTAASTTTQLLLVGWLTQLALALVYDRWLTPPPSTPCGTLRGAGGQASPLPETEGGSRLSQSHSLVFLLLNLGLPLAIAGQPGLVMLAGPWLEPVAAVGGLLQLAAGLLFAGHAWTAGRGRR